MKTYVECIPCFFKQAISASRMLGASSNVQKRIINRLAKRIPKYSLTVPPPVIARDLYRIISEETGNSDPFKKIKKQSTRLALKLYPEAKQTVSQSPDPFKKALEIAGIGNVIDFGAKSAGHIEKQMDRFIGGKMSFTFPKQISRPLVRSLKNKIKKSKTILYLADNAGETVFDRVLIEEIKKINSLIKISYAVRDKAIINDALVRDAKAAGIHSVARIISAGGGYPGIILKATTPEFKTLFKNADLVLSKGQGNYETLSDCRRELYFLFLVKCPVVAQHIKSKVGKVVLYKNS